MSEAPRHPETLLAQHPQPEGDGDGRGERGTEHRADRCRRFLAAAALRVLEAQGPELTMDSVAAEARVTKPVLYRSYQDEAALVQALD